ncbi:TMhelix containing protein [Vibrio phage 1.205.O._10N.222.51.A7]|nr:TMhelix containing protein [Vibrio phage 1.205.O._10N.222.51.A7]
MKNHYLMLSLAFLAISGCTINLQIDTDYASQNDGSGSIEEEVNTEATTTPTVDIKADANGL